MADRKIALRGAPWILLKRLKRIHADVRAGRQKKQILEVLVEGSAGGGKTFGLSLILYWLGETYPGIKILVIRSVRADLATTFQKVWEEDIVPPDDPMLASKKERRGRDHYSFQNGSLLVLGGMEDFMRHRGTDYDVIYFLELVEYPNEEDWSEFRRALRNWGGRAAQLRPETAIPFQLLLADTNPDAPDHWVNQRFPEYGTEKEFGNGRIFRLISRHQDNPKLFLRDGTATEEGRAYMDSLDALVGVRRDRLRDGIWVAAEGVVYENFSWAVHVVPRDERKFKWYAAGMDWGYTDPACLLVGGVDEHGTLVVVAEIYRKGQSIEWWTERVAELHRLYSFQAISASPDRPEVRDAFNRALGATEVPIARAADNARASDGVGDMGGIDLVRTYLERRKLLFFADRLLHGPDQELADRSQPTSCTSEFGSYIYRRAPRSGTALVNRQKELTDPTVPDHGMDALRYLLTFVHSRDLSNAPKKTPDHDERTLELAKAMGFKL